MNKFPIHVIPGLLAWIGGDSANFTANEISDILGIHLKEIERILDIFIRKKIFQKKGRIYTVTKWGSYAIDYSLLSILSRWSIESLIYSEYPYYTLQWVYLRYSRLPSRKMPFGIRSSYVLDFSNHFLKELTRTISSYEISDYKTLRNFVIKVSLHPTYTFLMSSDFNLRNLVKTLEKGNLLRVDFSDVSGCFVSFNSTKLGGLIDRYRKAKKEDTQPA